MRKIIQAVMLVTFLMLLPQSCFTAPPADDAITPEELAATPQYEKPEDAAAARGLEQALARLQAVLREIAELDILKRAEAAKGPAGIVRTHAEVPEKSRNAIFIVTYQSHGTQKDIQKVVFKDFDRKIEDRDQGYRVYLNSVMLSYHGLGKGEGSVVVLRPKMIPQRYGWKISENPLAYYQFMWDKDGRKTQESRTESKKIREIQYVPSDGSPLRKFSKMEFVCERPSDPSTAARFDRVIEHFKQACVELDQKLATGKPMLRPSPSNEYNASLESENSRERYSYRFTDSSGSAFREVRKDVFRYAGTDVYEKAGCIIDFQENGADIQSFGPKDSDDRLSFHPGMKPKTFSFKLEEAIESNEAYYKETYYEVCWDEMGKITRQDKKSVTMPRAGNPAP